MRRTVVVLALLLAGQLMLAWILSSSARSAADYAGGGTLLDFDPAAITRIEVDATQSKAVLVKTADNWALADTAETAVDQGKVTRLLDRLAQLDAGWPVARTAASHARFEVTPATFQRRIRLFQRDTLSADLFLGTAPAFRQTHARTADDDRVFAVELSSYDVPADAAGWRAPEEPPEAADGSDNAAAGPPVPAGE